MEKNKTNHLELLSEKYPTANAVVSRLCELNALLNLPKGTEHFMSDLHGEAEAFHHIRRSASGVIRNKINRLFSDRMTGDERMELATLIYYPKEKLKLLSEKKTYTWYEGVLSSMTEILRTVSQKYTLSEFRERIRQPCSGFEKIIEQAVFSGENTRDYFLKIYAKSSYRLGASEAVISAFSSAIRVLVIDRLHIVGDIFDRGERPDLIIDELMKCHAVDIEWGNHDVIWMGAAAGSEACCAVAVHNSLTYGNPGALEFGYGISLRALSDFASSRYGGSDCTAFAPRTSGDRILEGFSHIAEMNKAIAVIRLKLEGELILRNPDFLMNDRLLLDKIDKAKGVVKIGGKEYPLKDVDFPTLNENAPYELDDEERRVVDCLKRAFISSERLRRQVRFLYRVGSIYKIYNGNLLFHGCVPLNTDGSFMSLPAAGGLSGKALMDFCGKACRAGYFAEVGSEEKRFGEDFLWFLGMGKNSPLLGREKMATFERTLLTDNEIKKELKNAYYRIWNDENIATKILLEFGLHAEGSHIINGHIPQNRGESPIKAGGRLIVIDGGFCSSYHGITGIAGYTLIYNAEGMRLSAHEPFLGKEDAVKNNTDIASQTVIFETKKEKLRIRETDRADEIRDEMCELIKLLSEYKSGKIQVKTTSDGVL